MKTCGECHDWRQNHPDLPVDKRQSGLYGLCVCCWKKHTIQHEADAACGHWTERHPERLLRKCPQCQEQVWKWLHHCPSCGHDFRKRCKECKKPIGGEGDVCECEVPPFACSPRSIKANRPDGGHQHGWLAKRRAAHGW
jgi:hypothetical protein